MTVSDTFVLNTGSWLRRVGKVSRLLLINTYSAVSLKAYSGSDRLTKLILILPFP